MPALSDPLLIGGRRLPNRVVLAPLAGIGNWFVRLQARRFGAGLVVSEMVSSHAVHYRNLKTCRELLRIDPREKASGVPVSMQLFGADPDVMRSAAETVAAAGADLIDINMGCPVPKVCKTGAGAALLGDPSRAVAVARAAAEGSGLPVTVKLRSGLRAGERSGIELARRLCEEAGVAAVTLHPRPATVHHRGRPDYALVAELVASVQAPVLVSGGMSSAEAVREAFEETGAAGVMLARGALGNPWLFEEVLGLREQPPSAGEVIAELEWVIEGAIEHMGEERAVRYLRRFHPWYVERLDLDRPAAKTLQAALQTAESFAAVRALLDEALRPQYA
ncbi:MAG TPA: tRNA-dihydrouridine synthase [Solirubrobacteraceae bacterium]|jgi:nifR3 family TIM-barrel protein|nr:tRNA-dihydrouridine synthase [Solirubrobacteraceae bacterium]